MYNWLSINSKMKKITGIKTYNWGIPAYRSASGMKTCPNAAACVAGCYAKAGAYVFSNVAKVFEKRLALSLTEEFGRVLDQEIKRRKIERVRIHDSGDFYSTAYLDKWIGICRANPTVAFYAYTKMVTLLKGTALPPNLRIIYSQGGKEDKKINTAQDIHSRVFGTRAALRKAGYVDSTQDDAVAATSSNPKIGLVYHGTKRYENTNWSKVKNKA